MSSVLVEYPEGLPAPTTGEVRPTERRTVSSVGQMRNTRAIQRDRHGTRTVAFTFTPDQAAIFREWWVEWLQLGGGWFAANWPLPWSRGPNVFRFTDPPQWQLIGGRLNGQGYWQVRATCEIRGRGMLPTAEVIYLTSTPYPVLVVDEFETRPAHIDTPKYFGYVENIAIAPSIVSVAATGSFTTLLKLPPDDAVTVTPTIVNIGATSGPVLVAYNIPAESLKIETTLISVSSSVVLVTYTRYEKEAIAVMPNIVNITAS